MPRRKPVEAAEPAPLVAEPVKKTVRNSSAGKPKTVTAKAAHKHHTKSTIDPVVDAVMEAPVSIPATHDAIARLAYSFWEARGRQGGSSDQDWLRAESELAKLA
ncbi:MAG TPA: DUF2934 domain-containing protein [Bryobacteraceae bacterium]|nr:DUF2934 domain-containing protein [Bryobacteraceae bacterium]